MLIFKKFPEQELVGTGSYTYRHYGPRLPKSFQEVEYIQSAGGGSVSSSTYINTGFQYTQTTGEIQAKFIPLALSSSYAAYRLAGAYNGSNRSFIMYNAVSPAYIGLGGADYSTGIAVTVNTEYTVDALITTAGTCNYTLNSTTVSKSYSGSIATSKDYLLFCNNENGTPGNFGAYKLFYYKMYEAGSLIRHYVPCYCLESVTAYQGTTQTTAAAGTIGMYDLVENKFYINSGSGTFTKGPDVVN